MLFSKLALRPRFKSSALTKRNSGNEDKLPSALSWARRGGAPASPREDGWPRRQHRGQRPADPASVPATSLGEPGSLAEGGSFAPGRLEPRDLGWTLPLCGFGQVSRVLEPRAPPVFLAGGDEYVLGAPRMAVLVRKLFVLPPGRGAFAQHQCVGHCRCAVSR